MASQLQIDICAREDFKEYAEKAKSFPPATNDADKLVLYGLYKQTTAGDVTTRRPKFFTPPKERANVAEKIKDEAMRKYINKVKQLQKQTSTK